MAHKISLCIFSIAISVLYLLLHESITESNTITYRKNQNKRISVPLIDTQYINISFSGDTKLNRALVDTGASSCYLSQNFVSKTLYLRHLPKYRVPRSERSGKIADGTIISYSYKLKVDFEIGYKIVSQTFVVCPRLSNSIVLGQDFLRKQGVVISFLNEKVYFNHRPNMLSTAEYNQSP